MSATCVNVQVMDTLNACLAARIRAFHADVCKGHVDRAFSCAKLADGAVNLVFTVDVHTRMTRSGLAHVRLDGFALAQVDGFSNMHIHVLCARKGVGAPLLSAVARHATTLSLRTITLRSVRSAVTFWRRHLFRHVPRTQACNPAARQRQVGSCADGYRMSRCIV
jgi:GNAT superfamily N-acetyltransferase